MKVYFKILIIIFCGLIVGSGDRIEANDEIRVIHLTAEPDKMKTDYAERFGWPNLHVVQVIDVRDCPSEDLGKPWGTFPDVPSAVYRLDRPVSRFVGETINKAITLKRVRPGYQPVWIEVEKFEAAPWILQIRLKFYLLNDQGAMREILSESWTDVPKSLTPAILNEGLRMCLWRFLYNYNALSSDKKQTR